MRHVCQQVSRVCLATIRPNNDNVLVDTCGQDRGWYHAGTTESNSIASDVEEDIAFQKMYATQFRSVNVGCDLSYSQIIPPFSP
jgi:hypothetical protein